MRKLFNLYYICPVPHYYFSLTYAISPMVCSLPSLHVDIWYVIYDIWYAINPMCPILTIVRSQLCIWYINIGCTVQGRAYSCCDVLWNAVLWGVVLCCVVVCCHVLWCVVLLCVVLCCVVLLCGVVWRVVSCTVVLCWLAQCEAYKTNTSSK